MSTDDLLDEATRLHYEVIRDDRDAEWRRLTAEHDLVPALVERVQQAEMQWRGADDMFAAMKAERDAARAKLDKVRDDCERALSFPGDEQPKRFARGVLAILDGKTGD